MARIDETEKIIEDLIRLRTVEGYSTGALVRYLKDTYDYKKSRAFELIREARANVGEFYYKTDESVLEDALERMETMYQRAIERGDDKLALSVIQEMNKVKQLYINKIDLTSKGEKINIIINPNKDK